MSLSNKGGEILLKFTVKAIDKKFDLDELLEKIKNQGIDSLSEDEKNFLDRFGN
jgi:hypothetical protein